jgi:hypothetical protein
MAGIGIARSITEALIVVFLLIIIKIKGLFSELQLLPSADAFT